VVAQERLTQSRGGQTNVTGTFEVDDIFEVAGRGAVLAGRIRDGVLRVGMRLIPPGGQIESQALVLAGVEAIDNVGECWSKTGLVFTTRPTRAELAAIIAGVSVLSFSDEETG
jgi:hypothetical protein